MNGDRTTRHLVDPAVWVIVLPGWGRARPGRVAGGVGAVSVDHDGRLDTAQNCSAISACVRLMLSNAFPTFETTSSAS